MEHPLPPCALKPPSLTSRSLIPQAYLVLASFVGPERPSALSFSSCESKETANYKYRLAPPWVWTLFRSPSSAINSLRTLLEALHTPHSPTHSLDISKTDTHAPELPGFYQHQLDNGLCIFTYIYTPAHAQPTPQTTQHDLLIAMPGRQGLSQKPTTAIVSHKRT